MPVGRLIRTGLVGGIVSLFVAMTGLLAKVATINLIGTQVTGARVILMLSPFAAAYVAVRPRIVAGRIEEATTSSAARYGAVVGLAAGGLVAAALVFTTWYGVDRVREIFIQVDQALLDIVAFGKSMPVGALILTVGGVLMGAAGGAFRTLTPSVRRPIGTAVSVTLVAGSSPADHPDRVDPARAQGALALQSHDRWPDLVRCVLDLRDARWVSPGSGLAAGGPRATGSARSPASSRAPGSSSS